MFACAWQLPPCAPFTDEAPGSVGLVEPGSHESFLAELNDLLQLHCDRLGTYIDGRVAAHQEVLLRHISEHGPADPPLIARRGSCISTKSCGTLEAANLIWKQEGCQAEEPDSYDVPCSFDHDEMVRKTRSKAVQPKNSGPPASHESEKTDGSPDSLGQSMCQRLVESTRFEILVCMVIIANVIFLGFEVQLTMGSYHSPLVFTIVELAFAVLFIAEIVMRVLARGICVFVSGKHRAWNLLDVVLASTALFQTLIDFFEEVVIPNLVAARILRIFRMVRVFRIIRIMQFFRPLRILVSSLATTFKSLWWALTLLLMIIYLFGMLFTMAVSEAMSRPGAQPLELAEVRKHFGSLWASSGSLFKAMSGGMDWDVYSASLSGVGTAWSLLFFLFVAFSQIAVLNVITGIVCHGALEAAQHDQDVVVDEHLAMKERYVGELMTIFDDIDFDRSGSITLQEFEDRLKDPALRSYFAAMDLTTDEAWGLFKLLDTSKAGLINAEAFVSGCLKLKGTARSMDVHMLMYESRWMRRRLEYLTEMMRESAAPNHRLQGHSFSRQTSPALVHETHDAVRL